ncbi:thioesterase family protein [Hoeflea ulvae]|uniref:Thioesterase family protein n=1 Tax=Hoeflea ulvae TaxID=2983764 RepID=A0ABT3YEM3_9HYPH|nr:thioesterase family protein [Hoeflea ulvae]MCY0094343.1 thioesterase family protein [Hoeflea ulvae]
MLFDAPVIAPARGLDPAWLDYNGHLNMAYYNVVFDKAVDHAFELLGCGAGYLAARSMSFFTAESHVCYLRELKRDALVTASVQILDFDAKRVHLFQELRHVDGWLSATSETLALHIDMKGPKVAPMPDDILAKVSQMASAHDALPRPVQAGRSIGIKRAQPGGTD